MSEHDRKHYLSSITIQEMCNQAKEEIVKALSREGLLTQQQADNFLEKYAVVIYKTGWFGYMFDKLIGRKTEDHEFEIRVAKLV